MNFKPKMVFVSEAGLFYTDVIAWGGDLPNGINCELWWSPDYDTPGYGDTTAHSLGQRWLEETGEPMTQGIGTGYLPVQILLAAVEQAGTLDSEAVNKAMGELDIETINFRVAFDPATHISLQPLFNGQWQKTGGPDIWNMEVTYSDFDFLPTTADFLFPIPYD